MRSKPSRPSAAQRDPRTCSRLKAVSYGESEDGYEASCDDHKGQDVDVVVCDRIQACKTRTASDRRPGVVANQVESQFDVEFGAN